MTSLYFNATKISLREKESVLDGLLRHGFDIPNGCRAGACQACLMLSQDGDIPPQAQKGLREAQKKLGYFLSCSCFPSQPMKVWLSPDILERIPGVVKEKKILGTDVVGLGVDADISYSAGQYVTLWKDEKTPRSYSLASVPLRDNLLWFHIKRYENGLFSRWAFDEARVGDRIEVQGPFGECFYACSDLAQPLFLAGIGTGLAPLYGIVRDALAKGHTGDITLLLGARQANQFYLAEELFTLAEENQNFRVSFVARHGDNDLFTTSDIYRFTSALITDFTGYKVFLCGADSFVRK